MKQAYIAGPYRAKTREGVEENIQRARAVGAEWLRKGWGVFIPQMNTAHMEHDVDLGDRFFLDMTLDQMRRCDVLVVCPGWSDSEGTRGEIAEAHRMKMPTFYHGMDGIPDPDWAVWWD